MPKLVKFKWFTHRWITFLLFTVVFALFFIIGIGTSEVIERRLPPPESYTNMILGEKGPTGGFNQPHYVALHGDLVYVADSGNNLIQVFNEQGEYKFSFGQKGIQPGQFDFPDGIAISPKGEIFIGEIGNMRIQVFSNQGKYLREFKTHRPFKPGVMVFKDEDLYVADLSHQQVLVYGNQGELKLAFGQPGQSDGEFAFPSGIYPTSTEIYIADTNNCRIQVFDLTGKFLRKFGDKQEGPDSLNLPVGLGGLGSQIFVVDTFKHQIRVFTPQGKEAFTVGVRGIKDREFNFPEGLVVNPKGLLYVVDTGNNRVEVLSLTALNK
jgi:DNA-binding beta-propeller fold protein YncE